MGRDLSLFKKCVCYVNVSSVGSGCLHRRQYKCLRWCAPLQKEDALTYLFLTYLLEKSDRNKEDKKPEWRECGILVKIETYVNAKALRS